jgi:hypothetical protein
MLHVQIRCVAAMMSAFGVLASLSPAIARERHVNGVCGAANAVPVASAPISGLCQAGTPSAVSGTGPWTWSCAGANGGSTAQCLAPLLSGSNPYPVTAIHYAPNANIGSSGAYAPGVDGFTLADVDSVAALNTLPVGVKGLIWLGLCQGADSNFVDTVSPFIGNARVYGFYLMDEPDPTGRYAPLCPAANLKAESDWIHANVAGAKTFIVMMNMGTDTNPSYLDTYDSANTDIDLFGLDPYPCKTEFNGCNYGVINAAVAAAEVWGIAEGQIVPVYQAFGGGGYADWILPTASQEQASWAVWAALVAYPAFDYVYSWGVQDGDQALSTTPALQQIFAEKNAGQ